MVHPVGGITLTRSSDRQVSLRRDRAGCGLSAQIVELLNPQLLIRVGLSPEDKTQRRSSRQMVAGLNLADKIAKTRGITIDEALGALQTLGTPESAPIMAEFADDLARMMEGERTQEELDAELVTLFMRSRAEAKLADDAWTRLQDWSEDDTGELPEELFAEVVAFIEQERAEDVPEEPAGNAPTPKRRKPLSSSAIA